MILRTMKKEETSFVLDLINRSFISDERRSKEDQLKLMNREDIHLYILEDNEPQGFITIFESEEFVLIDHLAIDPRFRGQGQGNFILKALKKYYDKPILLEVEPPSDELTRRRIAFYKRNGYVLNPYDYELPPLSEGKEPVHLMIMSEGHLLSREDFNRYVGILNQDLYTKKGT